MSRYIPTYWYPNRMPVDISFVFENEKPAGKHGFCRVKGDKFEFEDGTPARFWGVIFNGATCFPEHEYAEGVARRLAQAGCNIVRFHQMDAEWATPNLYRCTAGKRLTNTRELSEESMERLCYLVKCLKEQGIYIKADITTYRKFKSGDGVHDANLLSDNMKGVALYDPTMIELQKEFAMKFWNTYNPYTGLKLKDDPAFVMIDITNENDLHSNYKDHLLYRDRSKYYDDMFLKMLRDWVKENGIDYEVKDDDYFNIKDPVVVDFRNYLAKKFFEEMYRFLREEVGIRIPICGTNWSRLYGLAKAQENMDFQDGHQYVYDWKWGEYEKTTFNQPLTAYPTSRLAGQAATRIHGQPFIMTEWDMPWPNSYRAEAPIWFPAMACLQGWSSLTIHTYSYGSNISHLDLLGKEASSSTIGSVPYREGIFTCWNDPSKFGLFYHGALMMRRGDVREAEKTIGARVTDLTRSAWNCPLAATAMETHRVDLVLDTTDVSDLDDVRPMEERFQLENPQMIVSDTGELKRNVAKRQGFVDTPMTKAMYGFLGNAAAQKISKDWLEITGLKVCSNTDFATIALSSLTEDTIENSDNILMSTIGRSRSRGAQFDGEKLIDFGTGPIECEVIDAEIQLKTNRENMRVWSVNSDGYYIGRVPTTYEDGWLKFHIGPNYPGIYYLIMEE